MPPATTGSARWPVKSAATVCLSTLVVFSLAGEASAQLAVTSVDPAPNVISAPRSATVTVVFSGAVNPSTVNASTFRVAGRWSGPTDGSFQFLNGNTQVRFSPDANFFAGEWVTVALSSDIAGAGGQPLERGFYTTFWTVAAPASLAFEDLGTISVRSSPEERLVSYGAFAGDLDRDGWTDLAVPNEAPNDVRVFMNDGAGNYPAEFSIVALPGNGRPSANDGGDFNGDGFIDIAVGGISSSTLSVLLGDGTGGFATVTGYDTINDVRGVCVLDFDADGDDDIVTTGRGGSNIGLHENDGSGSFTLTTIAVGSAPTSCAVGDADNNGVPDLFVGLWNDNEVVLLLGDGDGGFSESDRVSISGTPNGVAWQLVAGDFNLDGHIDVISVNAHKQTFSVLLGDGDGALTLAQDYPTDPFALSIDAGDIDGDGDLDVVVSSHSGGRWQVYENDGDGGFALPINYEASDRASCVVIHDRDNDGDLDVTGVDEGADLLAIFRTVQGPVGVDRPRGSDSVPSLTTAYPNPFVASTEVVLRLDRDDVVRVELFDALGRLVRVIGDGPVPAAVAWSFTIDGSDLAPGIYFVRASGVRFSLSRTIVRGSSL